MDTSTTSSLPCNQFDRSAEFYDAIHASKDYAGEAAVVLHHLNAPAAACIVDYGSGTGRFAEQFASKIDRVVTVDASDAMVKQCRLRFQNETRVNCYRASLLDAAGIDDVTRLHGPFNGAACMYGAMSYAADESPFALGKILRNVRQSLYYGARFVFDVVNYACCAAAFREQSNQRIELGDGAVLQRNMSKRFEVHNSIVRIDIEFKHVRLDMMRTLDHWNERHVMRAFTPPEVAAAAIASGFELAALFPAPGSVSDNENISRVGLSDYYFWVVLEAK